MLGEWSWTIFGSSGICDGTHLTSPEDVHGALTKGFRGSAGASLHRVGSLLGESFLAQLPDPQPSSTRKRLQALAGHETKKDFRNDFAFLRIKYFGHVAEVGSE